MSFSTSSATDFGLGTGVLQHTAGLLEDFFRPVEYDDEQSFISVEKTPRGVAAVRRGRGLHD